MKGAVDRVDIGELLTVREAIAISREAIAISKVVAAPEVVASRPDVARPRALDDISSVIRALLVGYDEV